VTDNAQQLKDAVCTRVDALREELLAVCRTIWEIPELGHQEHRASALLCETLQAHGLAPQRGIAGLATAFRADIAGANERPRVAVLAEYDALPGLGHGCGHNIIAASALGAALALASATAISPT
jgi:metal-dependent amidase/aminoacylase/carboxypeptidase family protein